MKQGLHRVSFLIDFESRPSLEASEFLFGLQKIRLHLGGGKAGGAQILFYLWLFTVRWWLLAFLRGCKQIILELEFRP